MFSRLVDIWNNYGFIVLGIVGLVIIVLISVYRAFSGMKGTWSVNPWNEIKRDITRKAFRVYQTPPIATIGRSKGEERCKQYLEERFRRPFIKTKPRFLYTPETGGTLELDCYNPDLGIAVEYNGIQHYKYTPHFHGTYERFLKQKERDEMKHRKCIENEVLLIRVPYTVPMDKIPDFIDNELHVHGW